MLGLDATVNANYKDDTENIDVWGIQAQQVYSYNVKYNTLVDEKWTGNEQRSPVWSKPRRKWTLEFKKSAEGGKKLEEFFNICKGRYKTFKFKWNSTFSEDNSEWYGDNKWYKVRFDTDELKYEIDYLGYITCKLDIVEVVPR